MKLTKLEMARTVIMAMRNMEKLPPEADKQVRREMRRNKSVVEARHRIALQILETKK